MGHMTVYLMVGTCQIEMTQLDMAGSWILLIGEVMDTCTILVQVLTGIMFIIIFILGINEKQIEV